jgi:hypothetical protein
MRSCLLVLALAAGCTFSVHGTDPLGSSSPQPPPGSADAPPTTTSDSPDAAVPPGASLSPPDLGPPDMTPKPKGIGDACGKDSDCAAGQVCLLRVGLTPAGDFPQGYCTQSCRATACPTGSVCQPLAGVLLCLAACPPAQCRQGYRCCGPSDNECLPLNLCD